MQIKNKFTLLSLIFLFFCYNLNAEEFNITANEITIDKNNEILKASGNVNLRLQYHRTFGYFLR